MKRCTTLAVLAILSVWTNAGQAQDDDEGAGRVVGAELVERSRQEQPDQPDHEAEQADPEDDQVGRQPIDLERPFAGQAEADEGEDGHRGQEDEDPGRLERVAGGRRQTVRDHDRPPRQDAADKQDKRKHGGQGAAAAEWSTVHLSVRYAPAP